MGGFLVIGGLVIAAGWVGKALADSIWLGPWEYRMRHSCGFRETFGGKTGSNGPRPHYGKACPRCGGHEDWSQSLCSYSPILGWRDR